jgi:hypothetical protein
LLIVSIFCSIVFGLLGIVLRSFLRTLAHVWSGKSGVPAAGAPFRFAVEGNSPGEGVPLGYALVRT